MLGLYAGQENTVTVTLYQGQSVTLTIPVPALDPKYDRLISMETAPGYLRDELIFVSSSMSMTMQDLLAAYDYRGDVRWCLNVPAGFDCKRLKNGNLLMSTERLVQPLYYMTGLYEMAMTGKIVREYSIPGAYHHDAIELENGDLLALTEDLLSDTVEDQLVLLSRRTGEVLRRWDFKDFLRPGDSCSGSWSADDWFHNNAVWYDKNTDSLTLSGRHMDAIVNIDYATGRLNWILGDPEGWPEDMRKYFFRPVGEDFQWQFEQHACLITPNGDVMCFDNGQFRSKIPEKRIKNSENYSRAVRYRINTEDMTVEQVWQYGKERGGTFFSKYISNVEFYGEGHYLVHSGGIILRDGVPVDGRIVAGDPTVRRESITVELVDDCVIMELRLRGNSYRAEKLPLYHDGDNLPLGEGLRLGSLEPAKELPPQSVPAAVGPLPSVHEGAVDEEDDRFTVHAVFQVGQQVTLLLRNGDEQRFFPVSTQRNPLNARKTGAYIKEKACCVTKSVSKTGLHGSYELWLLVDGAAYTTGLSITC